MMLKVTKIDQKRLCKVVGVTQWVWPSGPGSTQPCKGDLFMTKQRLYTIRNTFPQDTPLCDLEQVGLFVLPAQWMEKDDNL